MAAWVPRAVSGARRMLSRCRRLYVVWLRRQRMWCRPGNYGAHPATQTTAILHTVCVTMRPRNKPGERPGAGKWLRRVAEETMPSLQSRLRTVELVLRARTRAAILLLAPLAAISLTQKLCCSRIASRRAVDATPRIKHGNPVSDKVCAPSRQGRTVIQCCYT